MNKCPHCGSTDSYSYKIHGIFLEYVGVFGGGAESEDACELGYYDSSARPKFAKCVKCGKQIKLEDIRGE